MSFNGEQRILILDPLNDDRRRQYLYEVALLAIHLHVVQPMPLSKPFAMSAHTLFFLARR